MVESMSRPWSSVPRGYFQVPSSIQTGGVKASIRSRLAGLKGSCGVSQGAKTEAKRMARVVKDANIVTGDRVKL